MVLRNSSNLPRVSVVMAVHDGETYLEEALEAILGQSYTDLELIIVDDASRDSTNLILQDYAKRDRRIVFLRNNEMLGLTLSLNVGIRRARGEYLARQDADDYSLPGRFEAQVEFLDKNPKVGLLGTAYHLVDQSGMVLKTRKPPLTDTAIRWHMLFRNPFCHSSVMLRRKLLEEMGAGYNPKWPLAQDYELWSRMLQYTKGANLVRPLVCLRVHQAQVSRIYQERQDAAADTIAAKSLARVCGRSFSLEEVRVLRTLFDSFPNKLEKEETWKLSLFLDVLDSFGRQAEVSRVEFSRIRAFWFARIMALAPKMGRGGITWRVCAQLSLKHPWSLSKAVGRRLRKRVARRPCQTDRKVET